MTDQGITRVAAYALATDDEGRILLCRLSIGELDRGWWTLPGGGLDFGEDPRAAALRELEEESGLTGRIDGLADVDSRRFPPRAAREQEFHAIRVIYRVAVTGGELRDEVGGSTDRCAWFTRAEAEAVELVDLAKHALELLDARR